MDAGLSCLRLGFGVTMLNRCLWQGGIDGIGHYTLALLRALARRREVDLLPLSFGVPMHAAVPHASRAQVLPGFERVVLQSLLTGRAWGAASALARRLDLVHATDHRIPRLGKLPLVATLMDAIPLAHPHWVAPGSLGTIKRALWRRSAHWAQHVITISQHAKGEIVAHFGLPPERISVTPLGVDARWFQRLPQPVLAEAAVRLRLPERYFLCVGTLQPRKNLERVLAAYQSLPTCIRSAVGLLVVGRAGWHCAHLTQALESGAHGSHVRWLKHLPDLDLRALVQRATALVFPSLHEGFGLPVLEAFASGLPVLTSSTTSLPEVAGDAALLVDPLDEAQIAAAMQRLVEDNALCEQLRQRGLERAHTFTWARTAQLTLDVYRRVLER